MEPKTFYKIRFSDCDSFKHLHNSGYLDYMLNAREDHLNDFHNINMTDLYEKGSGWMVNRHEITYLAPALYNENVCIKSLLIKLADDSLIVEMSMWNEQENQLKALLWTKFIHIKLQTGKRSNHPDWFIKLASPLEETTLHHVKSHTERLAMLVKR